MFACEACAGRLGELEVLAASVRRLTEAGRFRTAVAPSLVEVLAARGLRNRTLRSLAGETTRAELPRTTSSSSRAFRSIFEGGARGPRRL